MHRLWRGIERKIFSGRIRWGSLADIQNGGVFCKCRSSSCFVKIIFPWPYNGRNLDLFSPGCYNEGSKLHFSLFFPWQGHFLRQKAKIGFHSTESNGSFFFLPLLVVWVHHLLRKLIHDHLHLISQHPLLEKCPKMGIREKNPMKDTSDSKVK